MEDNKRQFYALLQAGLWGKTPDPHLFTGKIDWKKIYKYSRQQAVLANVLDGINLLADEMRPPRELYLKWCAEVLHIEDENKRLDKEVVNLFKMLKANGVQPVLMKGQGISRNYPDPLHRISGDIDIYIGKKDYEKVNKLLSIEGEAIDAWSPKHIAYEWHGVEVENHRLLAKLGAPAANQKLNRLVDEWFAPDKVERVEIEGYGIEVPPLDFNIMYLLLHSVVHLMGYGVGLRQICDWMMLIHKNKHLSDTSRAIDMFRQLGMLHALRVFEALGVKYLGMPQEDLLLPFKGSDEKTADILIEDIWYSGNFGTTGERTKKRKGNYVTKRLKNMYARTSRAYKLRKVAPGEAYWKPFTMIRNFVKSRTE